jgi:hypothetical protein
MKRLLGALITSSSVGVLVTSALVVAQMPKGVPRDPAAFEKKTGERPKLEDMRTVAAKKAIAVARAAQLENMIQQIMRQARPAARAEVIFVRNVCELKVDQLRVVNRDIELALKEVVTKVAEAQQQGRIRVVGKNRTTQTLDGSKLLREHFASVMQKDLTPDQLARYQCEVEKRDTNRRQAGLHYLVNALDRDLYLTQQQRDLLTESLSAHWDDAWCACLEYTLYGNQFYPATIEAYVTPYLDASQKKAWQGTQRGGAVWGFSGVWGGVMNDNDALEVELGDVVRDELRDNAIRAEIQAKEIRAKRLDARKRIAEDAVPKK